MMPCVRCGATSIGTLWGQAACRTCADAWMRSERTTAGAVDAALGVVWVQGKGPSLRGVELSAEEYAKATCDEYRKLLGAWVRSGSSPKGGT
jgi:hypothetical protein